MNRIIGIGLTILFAGCAVGEVATVGGVENAKVPTSSTVNPETAQTPIDCTSIKGIIGEADISFDASTVIHFYSKPVLSGSPAQTLRFYDDAQLKEFSFKPEGPRLYSRFRPEVHKLDYFLFDLSVVKRHTGWLQVIVGDSSNETLWVQESKTIKYEDWLRMMKNSFGVGRVSPETNPVRARPDESSKYLAANSRGHFTVSKMKGDWIFVKEQNEGAETESQPVSGWVRWRDENGCLVVEIFPFA